MTWTTDIIEIKCLYFTVKNKITLTQGGNISL